MIDADPPPGAAGPPRWRHVAGGVATTCAGAVVAAFVTFWSVFLPTYMFTYGAVADVLLAAWGVAFGALLGLVLAWRGRAVRRGQGDEAFAAYADGAWATALLMSCLIAALFVHDVGTEGPAAVRQEWPLLAFPLAVAGFARAALRRVAAEGAQPARTL